MKFITSAAFLAAYASACMVDGDYSCHCLPQNFYAKQREAYMLYYSLMKSHGYELNETKHNPWQPTTTSKYAYQEYIPGENPYLGRWKATDDGSCWITAKDATRLNAHPVEVADEFIEKVEDDLNVTVEVLPNEALEAEKVVTNPTFADRITMLRGDYAAVDYAQHMQAPQYQEQHYGYEEPHYPQYGTWDYIPEAAYYGHEQLYGHPEEHYHDPYGMAYRQYYEPEYVEPEYVEPEPVKQEYVAPVKPTVEYVERPREYPVYEEPKYGTWDYIPDAALYGYEHLYGHPEEEYYPDPYGYGYYEPEYEEPEYVEPVKEEKKEYVAPVKPTVEYVERPREYPAYEEPKYGQWDHVADAAYYGHEQLYGHPEEEYYPDPYGYDYGYGYDEPEYYPEPQYEAPKYEMPKYQKSASYGDYH